MRPTPPPSATAAADIVLGDVRQGFVQLPLLAVSSAEQGDDRLDRWAAGLGARELGHEDRRLLVGCQGGRHPALDPGRGEVAGTLDLDRVNDWLSRLLRDRGVDIFRSKGILAIEDWDERYVFQGVHMLLDGCADRPWGDDTRVSKLVSIGRDLDAAELEESLRGCLVR